jgi:carbonic anhydrase/acetyltransferase-like protein (isoleucine patch superfamily)
VTPLIYAIDGRAPKIHPSAFIAPGAIICGDVEIGEDASVWYGCVLRGDTNKIVVGKGSNLQDGTIVHADSPEMGGVPTLIGANALIGHKCMLHGATVEDGGFVGMCSTMLDRSVVRTGGVLAAGAFLTAGKFVPGGEMWAGAPARKFRDLKNGEGSWGAMNSAHYVLNARRHMKALAESGRRS